MLTFLPASQGHPMTEAPRALSLQGHPASPMWLLFTPCSRPHVGTAPRPWQLGLDPSSALPVLWSWGAQDPLNLSFPVCKLGYFPSLPGLGAAHSSPLLPLSLAALSLPSQFDHFPQGTEFLPGPASRCTRTCPAIRPLVQGKRGEPPEHWCPLLPSGAEPRLC